MVWPMSCEEVAIPEAHILGMLRTQSQQERVADIGMARNHPPLAAFHRAIAAFRATADLSAGVIFIILAAALAFPPRRPRLTSFLF
jgi:hypothetical protein